MSFNASAIGQDAVSERAGRGAVVPGGHSPSGTVASSEPTVATPARSLSLPLGITMGDAAGIGPEIVVKCFAQGLGAPAVVYGDVAAMRRAVALVGARLTIAPIATPHDLPQDANVIGVIQCGPALPADLPAGEVAASAGVVSYAAVCQAIDDAHAGHLRAIVTAPLNKASMHAAGVDFPGHTEILAARTHTADFAMMLANDVLRVLLVTIHVPFVDVIKGITLDAEVRAMRLADTACRQMGIAAPRVAVAGLNPHAGENGKFGREDIDIIAPAIAHARTLGIDASGPWPGDTVFMRARQGEFDIVVAQYHDQGLIPVKYLGIDEGVNVTVGLPFVRTSVDHGTAFDIAWRGVADAASLKTAFDLALKMTP